MITTRTAVKNILAVYTLATEDQKIQGAQWYPNAHQIASDIAHDNNVSVEYAATVIAHFSPRLHWARNILGTQLFVSGRPTPTFLTASYNNAVRARDAYLAGDNPVDTLRGNKVKAFAANILGDPNQVTIDAWALKVILGVSNIPSKEQGITTKEYRQYEYCYQYAAKKLGIPARELQAITWIVKRNGRAD